MIFEQLKRRAAWSICTCVVLVLPAGYSFADDACLNDLRQIHRAELANKLPTMVGETCSYLHQQLKIDFQYADYYERCTGGVDGEDQAFDYKKRAAAVKQLISMNC